MPGGNRGLYRNTGPQQPGAFPWLKIHGYGTLGARPAPNSSILGFFYFASDSAGGTLYQCQLVAGTLTWVAITTGLLGVALLAGISGGQVLNGDTAATGKLTLRGTSNATAGNIFLNDLGGNVGIGVGWIQVGTSASNALRQNKFGYVSGTYYGVQLGTATVGNCVFLNCDMSANLSGNFNGTEVVIGNGAANAIIAPNAANNDYRHIISIDSSNNVHIGNQGSYNTHAVTISDTGNVTVNVGSVSIGSSRTTVNGSTSGSAVFTQPLAGPSCNTVRIYCAALLGTASYTFPTAFTHTPQIVTTNGPAAGIVTSLSASAVTLTGTTTTGFIILEGF